MKIDCLRRAAFGLAFFFCTAAQAGWQDKIDPELLEAPAAGSSWMIALPQTADLSRAAEIPDKSLKGAYVMQVLKEQADSTQQTIRDMLRRQGLSFRSYWVANAIHVQAGSLENLEQLARLPAVDFIYRIAPPDFSRNLSQPAASATKSTSLPGAIYKGLEIEAGLQLVRAPEVWDMGYEGQGVVVGDHDVGVEWTHPALQKSYRGYNPDTGSVSHDYNWRNAFQQLDPFCGTDEPCDSHSHGTHTTGTMVGEDAEAGLRIGMAPKAEWMACRSLFDPVVGVGTVPTYLDCMEWFIAPYPIGDASGADPAMAPDVINNSWGCLEACIPPLLLAADEATYAAGIVQVVSAGNDGDPSGLTGPLCSTIIFPLAVYASSFTVGASNFDDEMADFSSRGPVLSDLSGRLKPNVVAPGVGVNSSVVGGGYDTFSGTSMAAPHVAGLVALMMSAEPRLRGQVDLVRHLIQRSSVPINNEQSCGGTAAQDIPNNVYGYGRIDAKAAIDAIASMGLDAAAPAASRRAPNSTVAGGALPLLSILLIFLAGLIRRR